MLVALIGMGGIGKTYIALTVLHDKCIKQWFRDNHWFICCNQFPTSHVHFLDRLSGVIGADIENPETWLPMTIPIPQGDAHYP